jgi:cytochrome P450
MEPAVHPPGPPPRRKGLASIPFMVQFARDPLGFVGRRFAQYGDIYYAPSDGVPLYVIRHPDHIAQVLLHGAGKFGKGHTAFDRLSAVLGQGLLTTEGEVWKRQRRMVQPAFTRKRLVGYGEAMTAETERSMARWRDGQRVDMSREMVELTLHVVTRTLFDHTSADETDDVAMAMRQFNEYLGRPAFAPAWLPTPGRIKLANALRKLDAHIDALIDARQPGADRSDLLQSLVDAIDVEGDGGRMSRKELRDQLVTLYLAGHETTSHALSWTWFLLARNRAAQDALHAELDRVLGGRVPTYDDLAELPYTERVILESMRLFPPAFVVARKADVDTQLGDYGVAAGSEVVVWIYHTHRDPRWYAQPEVFRPERHAPEIVASRPKLAYLPFGAGPRACIGAQFSLVEARLVLATIAQQFAFTIDPGQRVTPKPGVTLAPAGGLPMTVHRRARTSAAGAPRPRG